MCKSILKGRNVPGTDGTYHGTDGPCPRDRRDAHQGVSRQNSLCLLFFSFPWKGTKFSRAFGKGVPDKAFHVEGPRGIPFDFCKQKGTYLGTWARHPVQTPFVTLLFRTLRAFGKGVSEKAFYLKVPWGVPCLFQRQKGTYLGTQGTYHLKLLF